MEEQIERPLSRVAGSRSIGVIGIACNTAAGPGVDCLWAGLLAGRGWISQTPPARWALACAAVNAPEPVLTGAFLQRVPELDGRRSGFTAAQAQRMDTHVLMLIDTMKAARADTGLSDGNLHNGAVGVFTATTSSDMIKTDAFVRYSASLGICAQGERSAGQL
jgi:acyl transferase domain-containing protein